MLWRFQVGSNGCIIRSRIVLSDFSWYASGNCKWPSTWSQERMLCQLTSIALTAMLRLPPTLGILGSKMEIRISPSLWCWTPITVKLGVSLRCRNSLRGLTMASMTIPNFWECFSLPGICISVKNWCEWARLHFSPPLIVLLQFHPFGKRDTFWSEAAVEHVSVMNDRSVRPFKITGRLYGPMNEALIKIDFDGFLLDRRHVYLLSETHPECCFAQASSHGVGIASPDKDLNAKHVTL